MIEWFRVASKKSELTDEQIHQYVQIEKKKPFGKHLLKIRLGASHCVMVNELD